MSPAAGGAMHVLVFNTGSSSLKCGLYRTGAGLPVPLFEAHAEAIGKPGRLHFTDAAGAILLDEQTDFAGAQAALRRIQAFLAQGGYPAPQAIGHRLVHGGAQLLQHALIDAKVLAQLRAAAVFAPLHVPAALGVIDAARATYPGLPQAACLDTAFHAGLPDEARVLPLPRELRAQGLRRYGFHGLSCESILAQLDAVPPRLIVAHLGSGASLTAIKHGLSIDTSMGLTPAGGIIMGTRSGDLDPGALLWLARSRKLDYDELEDMVMRHSGLAGISGAGGDMRRLRASAEPDAQLAVRMFCLSVAKQAAAQATALEGLDSLVFTGGIGEHDAAARAQICAHLAWTGLRLDETLNQAGQGLISAPGSSIEVRVIPAAENAVIARHVQSLVPGAQSNDSV
jgi:acetate kinase